MDKPLLLCLLLALAPAASYAADPVPPVPVQFAKGASATTLKGRITGYESTQYSLTAQAGQRMTVSVTGSRNANFNVFAPGDVPGQATAIGSGGVGNSWSAELPASGEYTVQVYQMRASARRGKQITYVVRFGVD